MLLPLRLRRKTVSEVDLVTTLNRLFSSHSLSTPNYYDVTIVGGGPAGSSLACALGKSFSNFFFPVFAHINSIPAVLNKNDTLF